MKTKKKLGVFLSILAGIILGMLDGTIRVYTPLDISRLVAFGVILVCAFLISHFLSIPFKERFYYVLAYAITIHIFFWSVFILIIIRSMRYWTW